MSVDGSRPLSTIQRPMRTCHQKSGSCSLAMNSERVTIITPPKSSVRALSRSVSRNATPLDRAAPGLERVGEVARNPQRITRVVVGEGVLEHSLLPADAKELACDDTGDGQRARPAGGGKVDADDGHDLAQVNRMTAQRVRAAHDEAASFGHYRERSPQVGQRPHRVGQPGRCHDVGKQDEPFATPAPGQERRRKRRERADEGDDDDGPPVIHAAFGEAGAVKDYQHREKRQGEKLLHREQVVRRLVHGAKPVPREQELAGEKHAEEQGRDEPAEDELPPIGPGASFHTFRDARGSHSRRHLIGQRRADPCFPPWATSLAPACVNSLTCPGLPSSITAADGMANPARIGIRRRHSYQCRSTEKGGESQMLNLYMKIRSLTTRQEGQGMVEYALILVLVSIVVIVILLTMGNQIKNVFSNVVAALG